MMVSSTVLYKMVRDGVEVVFHLVLLLAECHKPPFIKYHRLPWASLVAQLVKNPSAMQESPVQLEKGEDIHSSFLGLSWWLR